MEGCASSLHLLPVNGILSRKPAAKRDDFVKVLMILSLSQRGKEHREARPQGEQAVLAVGMCDKLEPSGTQMGPERLSI